MVFDALVDFAILKSSYVRKQESLLEETSKTVQVEGKRRNKAYQVKAILSVGKFIHEFPEDIEIVETYIDVMGDVLTEDYQDEIEMAELLPHKKSNKAQEAIIIEEFNLNFLKNVFASISPKQLHKDLLQFALESSAQFKNSDHEQSWRTCTGYNENFKILLEGLLSEKTSLSSAELNMIAKAFKTLFEFGDKGLLEKNVIMLARNATTFFKVFDQNGASNEAAFAVDNLKAMLNDRVSTITENELRSAIQTYQ